RRSPAANHDPVLCIALAGLGLCPDQGAPALHERLREALDQCKRVLQMGRAWKQDSAMVDRSEIGLDLRNLARTQFLQRETVTAAQIDLGTRTRVTFGRTIEQQ